MPIKFCPNYTISPVLAQTLMDLERAKQAVADLPLNPAVMASFRQTAKLYTTHYSTMIEGNRLDCAEVREVVELDGHFPGRARDEKEVKGYYSALAEVDRLAKANSEVSEAVIQRLHALAMGDGRTNVKNSVYRDGQNVIRDASSGGIVYMPPEAGDVCDLMDGLIEWINECGNLPCPLVAAIVHYQFATIHPYYDGNGRCARLLTTLVLHLGGFDLKGLYSLEEYYAQNLGDYYAAIGVGPSHNYYLGRAEADITEWIEYFCEGMKVAFDKVVRQMVFSEDRGELDHSEELRELDAKQRRALSLFKTQDVVTSSDVGQLFDYRPRTASKLCKTWVESGFLVIVDPSKRGRKYRLSPKFSGLI